MSLNPEMEAVNASGGNHATRPVPYAGEVFIASRSSCRLAVEDTAGARAAWFARRPPSLAFSGAGTVYLTNFRLVFVASKPTPDFQSIELPLLYIRDFDVVQPIFGANYLHGICEPTADSSAAGMIKWRVSFMAGGMSTMVPLFYRTVAYVRSVASSRDTGVQEPSGSGEATKPGKMSEFVASAVVDPNDPTVVFVVSEQDEDDRAGRGDCGNHRHGRRVGFDTAWTTKKTQ